MSDPQTEDDGPETALDELRSLRESYDEQKMAALRDGDERGAAYLGGQVAAFISAEETIAESEHPRFDETPVTLNTIEFLLDAHPDYRLTSHRSDGGVEYRLLQVPVDGDEYESGASAAFVAWVSNLTTRLDAEDNDEWPDYPCPECRNNVWLDGFDDATTVAGEEEYREVRHCGVCEFVAIRRVNDESGDASD